MSSSDFPESPLAFGMFDWIESSGAQAADVFEHKMRLVEMADKAGFFAWQIAEHQGTPLSIDGSPSVMIAAAIQRTKRLRLGALTWCLPWQLPYRFYSEICMLDQMSRGRIELGVGRGISPIESKWMGIDSIEESRERYRETLDIFFEACKVDVLDWKGRFFEYKDLELHIKPAQKPYPPLWFPSSDRNSIEFIAKHGYNTVLNTTLEDARKLYDHYREVWVAHRDDPGRHNAHVAAPKLGKTQLVFIADTDAQAEKTGLAAYSTWVSHINYLTKKRSLPDLHPPVGPTTRQSVTRIAVGSPKTVAEQLIEVVKGGNINYLLLVFSFGDLPIQAAEHSMALFVKDVMPAVRAGTAR